MLSAHHLLLVECSVAYSVKRLVSEVYCTAALAAALAAALSSTCQAALGMISSAVRSHSSSESVSRSPDRRLLLLADVSDYPGVGPGVGSLVVGCGVLSVGSAEGGL